MAAGSTYTPIANYTSSGSAASYTFSSISGSYTDLILVMNFGINRNGAAFSCQVGNGSVDTGTNYSNTQLYGDGTSAASTRSSSTSSWSLTTWVGYSTTISNNAILQFQNYSNTTTYKTMLARTNNAAGSAYPGTSANVNLWRSTSAINTIKLLCGGTDYFLDGSTFTLYGITAA